MNQIKHCCELVFTGVGCHIPYRVSQGTLVHLEIKQNHNQSQNSLHKNEPISMQCTAIHDLSTEAPFTFQSGIFFLVYYSSPGSSQEIPKKLQSNLNVFSKNIHTQKKEKNRIRRQRCYRNNCGIDCQSTRYVNVLLHII